MGMAYSFLNGSLRSMWWTFKTCQVSALLIKKQRYAANEKSRASNDLSLNLMCNEGLWKWEKIFRKPHLVSLRENEMRKGLPREKGLGEKKLPILPQKLNFLKNETIFPSKKNSKRKRKLIFDFFTERMTPTLLSPKIPRIPFSRKVFRKLFDVKHVAWNSLTLMGPG